MTALPPCRAVITGVGCVSPFGLGGSELLARLLRTNASAIAPIRNFSTETFPHHLGAEVVATNLVQDEEGRRWSRVSQMAVAACRLAVAESRLSAPEALHPSALVVGTEFGDLQSTESFNAGFLQRGPRGLRALLFPNTVMNSIAGLVSLALGIKGPILTLNQAGVAGELAVARAIMLLAARRARVVVACGVDELFSVLYDVLGRLHIPSPRDGGEEACRPFDQHHNGPVLGEGATALVIETVEHAQARGATMLAGVYDARWGAFPTRAHRYPKPAHLHHRLLDHTFAAAAIASSDVGVAYLSGSGDPQHDTAELDIISGAFGSAGPLLTSVTHLNGDYGSLGALRVAAATITATQGVMPSLSYLDHPLRADVRFARHAGSPPSPFVLVHGLARDGVQAALLIGPPPV